MDSICIQSDGRVGTGRGDFLAVALFLHSHPGARQRGTQIAAASSPAQERRAVGLVVCCGFGSEVREAMRRRFLVPLSAHEINACTRPHGLPQISPAAPQRSTRSGASAPPECLLLTALVRTRSTAV